MVHFFADDKSHSPLKRRQCLQRCLQQVVSDKLQISWIDGATSIVSLTFGRRGDQVWQQPVVQESCVIGDRQSADGERLCDRLLGSLRCKRIYKDRRVEDGGDTLLEDTQLALTLLAQNKEKANWQRVLSIHTLCNLLDKGVNLRRCSVRQVFIEIVAGDQQRSFQFKKQCIDQSRQIGDGRQVNIELA